MLVAGDFMATPAVEATIHQLDMLAGDDGLAGPAAEGLAAAWWTLGGLFGQPAPTGMMSRMPF